MSRDASVSLPFADDDYVFRLAWGELATLQEERDAGAYVVLDRLLTGRWFTQDISAVLRLGLIGGGMEPVKALKMVRSRVESRPPLENLVYAQRVLGAAIAGVPEEEVGKKSAAANQEGNDRSPTENSDLPPSTETVP